MTILSEAPEGTRYGQLDPRTRIFAAVVTSILLALVPSIHYLDGVKEIIAGVVVLCLWNKTFITRFLLLNIFSLSLLAFMPWSVAGDSIAQIGSWRYTKEGLEMAGGLSLRANAILAVITMFIGTLEPIALGHALQRMGCPSKLVQLLLFTVRYLSVFENEYSKLRQSMTLRAFEPRLDLHTLHSYGNLVGMLLVGALDRSERINQAMRCRAFSGQFPLYREYSFAWVDLIFIVGMWLPVNLLLAVLVYLA